MEEAQFTEVPRGVFESTPMIWLPKMHSMPVSDCTVMGTSHAKIMAAIVWLWPCYTSLCTKLPSPIALLNSEPSNT